MSNLVRHAGDTERFLLDNRPALHPLIPKRLELLWIAGQRGKPGINADINSATESVREIADPDFEILGTNAVSADCTFNAEGGITLTTAGAADDQMILLPHLDANQTAWTKYTWGTDREVWYECLWETGTNITNAIIWNGLKLTNTQVSATDADQVFVRYENDVNSGKFQVVDSIGGTDVTTDSGITVVLSTKYHIAIKINTDRTAEVYINGQLVRITSALTDAIDLIPYLGVEADGATAAKDITVHACRISRLRGA